MDVPVHDQDAFDSAPATRMMGADGDVTEETESHPRIPERMMSRRTHGAEGTRVAVHSHVDGIEQTAHRGAGSIPRAVTDHRVRVECAAAPTREILHFVHVSRVVRQQQVVFDRMTTFVVLEGVVQFEIFS
jgi:hypothetical protein